MGGGAGGGGEFFPTGTTVAPGEEEETKLTAVNLQILRDVNRQQEGERETGVCYNLNWQGKLFLPYKVHAF